MAKVLTGLHREPTFEELLRQRDPTVHVPIRSAWELRNSPFMSVFDAEWLQGAGNPGFLDHLHDEGDQLAQNRTMQEFFRQAGVPYRAQGTDGGPPPSIPPRLGGTLAGAGQHQDAAQNHMAEQAVAAVHQAMQGVMNARSVASQITTSSRPEEDELYQEPTRDPAVMARNWQRARRITHGILNPTLGILGATAGATFQAPATVMGAMGHAVWAGEDNIEDETEPEAIVHRSRRPTPPERKQSSAHFEQLKRQFEKDPDPPDTGGASSSKGPGAGRSGSGVPRRSSGRSGGV